MSGAARVTDKHVCPKTGHTINAIESGEDTVLINGLPAATVGSVTSCGATIITGSSSVTINGKPAAIIGSATSHGGVIVGSSGNVFFGDMAPKGCLSSSSTSTTNYDEQVRLINEDGIPVSNAPFYIQDSSGKTYQGITDDSGLCPRVYTDQESSLTIYTGVHALEMWSN